MVFGKALYLKVFSKTLSCSIKTHFSLKDNDKVSMQYGCESVCWFVALEDSV